MNAPTGNPVNRLLVQRVGNFLPFLPLLLPLPLALLLFSLIIVERELLDICEAERFPGVRSPRGQPKLIALSTPIHIQLQIRRHKGRDRGVLRLH
jgi:hypothetical protein